jgi:predicted phage baseplate assembly protein
MYPSFPCYKAPGVITVIVLPHLPQGGPIPTPGLLNAVAEYLRPKRVIGTRVEVVGPTYLTVAVQASVQSQTGANRGALQQAVVAAINKFLDPIEGGPDGTGWPFGRDVYRSEIMKVIDSVPGVDYVVSLALLSDCGTPQCGNVCLGPTWLVKAGTHQITVI